MTAAIRNNINELDMLLTDLSRARYNGQSHIERKETIVESRTYTSHSTRQDVSAPIPPQRSKHNRPRLLGGGVAGQAEEPPFSPRLNSSTLDSHRMEKTVITSSNDNGAGEEKSWEYKGYGIWERDGSNFSSSGQVGYQDESWQQKEDIYSTPVNDSYNDSYNVGYNTNINESSYKESYNTSFKDSYNGSYNNDNGFEMRKEEEEQQPAQEEEVTFFETQRQEDQQQRGAFQCARCRKPITGRCITAMFRKFHPECFVCSFCTKQLNKGTFKEQGDKPYCHVCFDRLFG